MSVQAGSGPVSCGKCDQEHDPRKCRGHVDACRACGHSDGNKVGEPCRGCGSMDVHLRPCRSWPLRGATVCTSHGGAAPQVRRAAARQLALAAAEQELAQLGGLVDVEPAEAMVAMVQEAAWNVAVYRRLVQTLELQTIDDSGEIEYRGDEDVKIIDPRVLASGLAARVDPANWRAAPHVWVAMYDAERERLVKWAKACRDAGVDEHRMRLLEGQAEQLVGVAHDIAAGLQAALMASGLAADLVASVVEESLPAVMRQAFERAQAIEVQAVGA